MTRNKHAEPPEESLEILETTLRPRLETLRVEAHQRPETAARGRAAYLAQVQALQPPTSVQSNRFAQLTQWIFHPQRPAWVQAVIVLLLVTALVFGSKGVTVYAAQSSLPGESFYPVKTLSEDTRLNWASTPEAHLNLLLTFISRRVEEISLLQQAGRDIPTETLERLDNQVEDALQLSGSLPDQPLVAALTRLQKSLRSGEENLAAAANLGLAPAPALLQARTRLQAQIRLTELGAQNPLAFRQALRQRHMPQGAPTEPEQTLETPPASGNGAGAPGAGGVQVEKSATPGPDPANARPDPGTGQPGSGTQVHPGPGAGPGAPGTGPGGQNSGNATLTPTAIGQSGEDAGEQNQDGSGKPGGNQKPGEGGNDDAHYAPSNGGRH